MAQLQVIRAGLVDYERAWQRQRELHEAVVAGREPDSVLLLEHPAVYTAGKRTLPHERPNGGAPANGGVANGGTPDNQGAAVGGGGGTPVIDVDRGGKITWHGPGQLVGYPIVRLPKPIDVVAYVRRMEKMLIAVCAELGLPEACQVAGRSGVWLPAGTKPERKLAQIGLRVSQGVTMHGFALNCDCDLSWANVIVPCGIPDAGVTSLSAELGRDVSVAEVIPVVEAHLPALLAAPVAA